MKYNTAIAQMMTLVNEFYAAEGCTREELKTLILLLYPVAPHIAEEMWERMGFGTGITLEPWPKYDEQAMKRSEIEIAVQILGKVRGRILIHPDMTAEQAEKELPSHPQVQSAGRRPADRQAHLRARQAVQPDREVISPYNQWSIHMENGILQINAVSRAFGKTRALKGLSVTIPKGKIVGLLGRNGAGKSTLLRIVGGMLRPSGGSVTIADQAVWDHAKALGLLCIIGDTPDFGKLSKIKDLFFVCGGLFPGWDNDAGAIACEAV